MHEEPGGTLFVLIWSALMLFATIQHVRMEYYIAANIALLVAAFVRWAITFAEKDLMQTIKPQKTEKTAETPAATKNKKSVAKASSSPDWIKVGVAAIVVIIVITFVATSAATAVQTDSNYGNYGGTEKDWIFECTWMLTGTSEPSVDYL